MYDSTSLASTDFITDRLYNLTLLKFSAAAYQTIIVVLAWETTPIILKKAKINMSATEIHYW